MANQVGAFQIDKGFLVNFRDQFPENNSSTTLVQDFMQITVNLELQRSIAKGEVGYAVERLDGLPIEDRPYHKLFRCGGNIRAWRQRWGCLVRECEASTEGHGIFRGQYCTGSQCYFCFSCALELRSNDGKCPLGCGQPWDNLSYQFAPYEAGLFDLCQIIDSGHGQGNDDHFQEEPRAEITWIRRNNGQGHENAVRAGTDSREPVYVIRASHLGGVVPGKLHAGRAYIPYNYKEIVKPIYEIMTCPSGTVSWVETSLDIIPRNAVVGGRDPSGEVYYIGRAAISNTLTCGKVHPSHKACYISYDGREHAFQDSYEILVQNN